MAVDADTKKYLEEVKKGKARKFVMICKGVKILSLIIYKKGNVEKYKKQAKEESKGQFYHGVVSGQGQSISFNLLRSDGFDKPPGKELILKDFLKSEADMKFKPTYEIVDELPAVPFDEEDLQDPLIARFMKMEPVINKACEVHPESIPSIEATVKLITGLLQDDESRAGAEPKIEEFVQYLKDLLAGTSGSPPPPHSAEGAAQSGQHALPVSDPTAADAAATLATKLAEALKKLKPLMDQVINADPSRKGELHATMAQIAGEIKAKQLDQAKQDVTNLATLLKSLAAQQTVAASGESVDQMFEFARQRDVLEPRLLEAQRADREKATQLGAVWTYANEQAQANNLTNAFQALDRLETAIQGILSRAAEAAAEPRDHAGSQDSPQPAEKPDDAMQSALRDRLARIEPLYLRIVAGHPAERTRISATMSLAIELIDSAEFDRAAATLDRLEKLLASPGEPELKPVQRTSDEPYYNVISGEGQLVSYRKALLAWDAARKSARIQLDGLKTAIANTAPGLAKSAEILDGVLDRLDTQLSEAIDAAINAQGLGLRAREHARAGELARSYLMTVNFDPVFSTVDRNPVQPLTLRATLGAALSQVVAALPI